MNKAKVFALYLGSKVLDDQEVIRELRAVHNHGFCTLSYNDIGEQEDINIDDFQLILTPLELITDEDAIEVANMLDVPKMYAGTHQFITEDKRIEATKKLLNGERKYVNPYDALQAFDFLRSRSYAIPFEGQDLYESGIAIKPIDL